MIATSEDIGLMEAKARRIAAHIDKFPEVIGTSCDPRKAKVTDSFDFIACRTLLSKKHTLHDSLWVSSYLKSHGITPHLRINSKKWSFYEWAVFST